ncbi:MAG: hypothetical protein NTY08_15655 [Proteobacteria bacterium]|nr:hypothetical protein [Pseudomonadota bacterium]
MVVTTLLSASHIASASPLTILQTDKLPVLHAGDVVLIALNCYICGVISETTESPYNHSGLILDTDLGLDSRVAQSLQSTQELSLSDFLHQGGKTSPMKILRPRELDNGYKHDREAYESSTVLLNRVFAQEMRGRAFDDNYLWNNVDSDGHELLYCSEMIQKTLNHVLAQPLTTIALDYSRHWDFWLNYFDGKVPQGEQGNSPASLANADQLMTIFEGTLDTAP